MNALTRIREAPDLADLVAATDAIRAAGSIESLAETASAVLRGFGLRYMTCVTVRMLRSVYLHEANFQTWPAEAVLEFARSNLFRHDPIIARSRVQNVAFFWSLDDYDPTNTYHQQIVAIRQRWDIDSGCCIPVPERVGGHSGGRMVLYTSGSDVPRSEASRVMLQLLGGQIASQLATLSAPAEPEHGITRFFETTGLLTTRERQILSWIASGKSSWEISQILAISEHTVNTHIEKALVKLEATNRTEAVVKAVIMNEVDINPR